MVELIFVGVVVSEVQIHSVQDPRRRLFGLFQSNKLKGSLLNRLPYLAWLPSTILLVKDGFISGGALCPNASNP